MVWAAMKKNGAVCLRRCPPRMNAAAYQDILESAKAFIRPRYVLLAWFLTVTFVSQYVWLALSTRWRSSSSCCIDGGLAEGQQSGSAQWWRLATDVA
jgi:hypothetical protein